MSKAIVFKIFVGLCVVLLLTLSIFKFVVEPMSLKLSDYSKLAHNLTNDNKKLKITLDNVKAAVRVEINKSEARFLEDYIMHVTDNITRNMAKKVAEALTKAAWEHKVPTEFAVGISQAITKFNPTYLDAQGNRGLLAYPVTENYDGTIIKLHDEHAGAAIAAKKLGNITNSKSGTSICLDVYFNNQTTLPVSKSEIMEATTEYLIFVYNKRRKHEAEIDAEAIKKKLTEQTKKVE